MDDLHARNRRAMLITLSVVAAMVALSFAAVPLYRKLCQVTGWGGTTQTVEANPHAGKVYDRVISVRFNADTNRDMPWRFMPDANSVDVRVGQDGFISYTAINTGDTPVTGTAVYNVTPLEAGKYFYKTQCFCFSEQTLKPHETVHMPVVFYVDPAIMKDRDLRDVNAITLSYTFYKKDSAALDKAVEKFMEEADNPLN